MTYTLSLLIVFGLGYLLGSIPFGLLLTKAAGLGDVRKIGSGNIGATNVLQDRQQEACGADAVSRRLQGLCRGPAGRPAGGAAAAAGIDPCHRRPSPAGAAVGAERILQLANAARHLQLAQIWKLMMTAGLGAFLGHVYPVWLGFKGGKGVATYIGVLLGAGVEGRA